MSESSQSDPRGELQIRTLAMPADTNPSGDIFGGWVLSQMDVAGGILAATKAKGRVATVAVDGMTFYLCNDHCAELVRKDPQRFAEHAIEPTGNGD